MHIYTLGTSLRSEKEFVGILKRYKLEAFLDVRSFPRSKLPTFNRVYLEELITKNGLVYHFLGKELGGFRKGGYEKYTRSDAFQKGIDKVEQIAQAKVSVIVCAEKLPWKCHRRFIASKLQKRGWETVHIIEIDKVWEPQESLDTSG